MPFAKMCMCVCVHRACVPACVRERESEILLRNFLKRPDPPAEKI